MTTIGVGVGTTPIGVGVGTTHFGPGVGDGTIPTSDGDGDGTVLMSDGDGDGTILGDLTVGAGVATTDGAMPVTTDGVAITAGTDPTYIMADMAEIIPT